MKASLRILNLEDDANDAELNEAMISARWPGCEFKRVGRRKDYIAALERADFDLILSDYTMPDFDGRQALALAREKCPDIPFLFVSGTIGEDAAIEALKNGATDYVLKHRLMRLIPAVDRALREAEERAAYAREGVARAGGCTIRHAGGREGWLRLPHSLSAKPARSRAGAWRRQAGGRRRASRHMIYRYRAARRRLRRIL